jgi:hypothetical protein
MKIINYDKEKEILAVRANTKHVWEYSPIEEKTYDKIVADSSGETLKYFLRHLPIVGIYKGVTNELR